MAKVVLFAGGNEAFTSSATARFTAFGNVRTGIDYFASTSTDIEYQDAGTLEDFSVVVYGNNRSGVGSSTSGPYINGSASAISVTIPIATTGRFTDTTNTASVAANDDLSLGTHPQSGGGGALQIGNWLCVFDQTTGSSMHHVAAINGQAVGASTTYVPLVSGASALNFNSTEANVTIGTIAGTFSHVAARSTSNGRNGDTVITFRKNGADATGTVTIPASTTGSFVDTTNSDSVIDGDDVNYKVIRGGTTGTVTLQTISAKHSGTGDAFMAYLTGDAAFSPVGATDYFLHIGGLAETGYTDALTKQLWPLDNFEASTVEISIPTNSIASASAFVFRLNGADSALRITIPASTTGRFTNTSDVVSLMDGDEINYKLAAGGTGNITFRQAGIKFAPAASGGVTGDIAQNLFFLSQSLTGNVLVQGTAAQTLSFLSQSLAGSVLVSGEAAQALSFLTEALTGNVLVEGDAAQTLRFLTQALSGANITAGDIAQTLAFLSQAIEGNVLIQGTAAQTLSFLSQSLSGSNVSAGDIAQTLARITQALSGSVLVDGDLAQTLRMITQQLYSVTVNQGDIAQTLPFLTQSLLPQEKLIKIYNILFETVKVYNIRFESTKIYNIEV